MEEYKNTLDRTADGNINNGQNHSDPMSGRTSTVQNVNNEGAPAGNQSGKDREMIEERLREKAGQFATEAKQKAEQYSSELDNLGSSQSGRISELKEEFDNSAASTGRSVAGRAERFAEGVNVADGKEVFHDANNRYHGKGDNYEERVGLHAEKTEKRMKNDLEALENQMRSGVEQVRMHEGMKKGDQ